MSDENYVNNTNNKKTFRLSTFVPLAVFIILSLTLLISLNLRKDSGSKVDSFDVNALVGEDIPNFELGDFSSKDIAKENFAVINFFASWCVPCLAEHEFIKSLSTQHKIPVYGIATQDMPDRVSKWLEKHGNSYKKYGVDVNGRVAINFGLTGTPETFVIKNGKIISRYRGPINPDIIQEIISSKI